MGTPEQICKVERSYTGQFLSEILQRKPIENIKAAE
jgi:excinuclease UvrABC ATPase subunit